MYISVGGETMIRHSRITKNGQPGLRVTFDPSDPEDMDFILSVMAPAGLVPSNVADDLRDLSTGLKGSDFKSLLKLGDGCTDRRG